MKKKYLFPLIYIGLFSISFFVPFLAEILIMYCGLIIILIGVGLTTAFDFPSDGIFGIYDIVIGTIVQFFLLGCLWDYIAEWFKNKPYGDR